MIPPLYGNKFINLLVLIVCCGFFIQTEAQQSRKMPVGSEVRFDSGNSARNIPFELHNNHIYLQVKANNSEPLSFILDTGASSVISRKRAASLGLKFSGKEQGFGVGENAVEASFVEGVLLDFSGATLSRQKIAVVALEDLQKSLGRQVDGILGDSFLRRFVVEIDYVSKTINLYSPKSYSYRGKGERVPLIADADSGLIFARATLKLANRAPIKGLFEIDSGGGHALILNSPFVERNNLLTAAQKANVVLLGGIAGSSRAVAGTVENLQLGRSGVENVSAFFSQATDGMLANEEFDGNIGNDILRRFKVVFDYSRRLMILESAK
ncbi:MAG TPA: retropepsin-like aspartic protease [Pyrinomonadaceae bacterium]